MFGEHTIGFLEVNNKEILSSTEKLREISLKACKDCSINVVGEKSHLFENPRGLTYCFILSQSHLILHTWPENSRLYFDIFTCDKNTNSKKFIDLLANYFDGKIGAIKTFNI